MSRPPEPNYPARTQMSDPNMRITRLLCFLYGETTAAEGWSALAPRLDTFRRIHPGAAKPATSRLTQRDAILMTYCDQFRELGPPLQTLRAFRADANKLNLKVLRSSRTRY